MKDDVIDFNYDNLFTDEGKLSDYIKMCDFNLKSINHTKMKNYVTNSLYSSNELSEGQKNIFLFLYDLKAQQKYLPGIYINQSKLAFILGKSESQISKDIGKLMDYNLVFKISNEFGEEIIIPNENIINWGIPIDVSRLKYLEEVRKHTATSNTTMLQRYKEMQV